VADIGYPGYIVTVFLTLLRFVEEEMVWAQA